jgi:hypothetical protein
MIEVVGGVVVNLSTTHSLVGVSIFLPCIVIGVLVRREEGSGKVSGFFSR